MMTESFTARASAEVPKAGGRKFEKRNRRRTSSGSYTERPWPWETTFGDVIDRIGLGVALISPRMEVLTLNAPMKRWFPSIVSSERPICHKFFKNPPLEEICFDCPIIRTLQDGQVHEASADFPWGAEMRNFRIISSPRRDLDGKITAATVIFDDKSDHLRAARALTEGEDKYRLLAENVSDVILTMDFNLRPIYISPSFTPLCGYRVEEAMHIAVRDLMTPASFKALTRVLEQGLSAGEKRPDNRFGSRLVEIEFICKNKSRVWTEVRLTLLRGVNEIPVGVMAVVRNIAHYKRIEAILKKKEKELELKSTHLEEINISLKALLRQREQDRTDLESDVLFNVRGLIWPLMKELKSSCTKPEQIASLNLLEANVNKIISPFLRNLTLGHFKLTTTEIHIANLIKDGRTSRDIANVINVARSTVDFHRGNIRTKLNIRNRKINLRSYLLSIS